MVHPSRKQDSWQETFNNKKGRFYRKLYARHQMGDYWQGHSSSCYLEVDSPPYGHAYCLPIWSPKRDCIHETTIGLHLRRPQKSCLQAS